MTAAERLGRCLRVALAMGLSGASASGQRAPLQAGTSIAADSVTVGDPFQVAVRIRAPRGATVEFPTAPDTSTGVGLLSGATVLVAEDTTALDQTATYRLAAWDVGELPIRFPDAVVREGAATRRVPLARLTVRVVSVLPADSSLHVPKPPRDVFGPVLPWWWWLVALLALAALAALVWWWWRRRQRPKQIVRLTSPYEDAMQAFARLEALGLVPAGEYGHFTAVSADVLRTYLARVFAAAPESLTSTELVHALRGEGTVPAARLATLMQQVDLVKFASARLDAERAVSYAREAQSIVEAVERARRPPPVLAEAA